MFFKAFTLHIKKKKSGVERSSNLLRFRQVNWDLSTYDRFHSSCDVVTSNKGSC